MLVDEKQFDFVIPRWLTDRDHQDIEHPLVEVGVGVQIEGVDKEGDLEGVVFDANFKQLDELLVRDVVFPCLLELVFVVLLAIHLKYDVDVLRCGKKPLSVVFSHSRFDIVVNYDLLEVGLVVPSVSGWLHREIAIVELLETQFGGEELESLFYQFIISRPQEVNSILVPQLDELEGLQNQSVHHPQVIIDGEVENLVVDHRVDLLSWSAQLRHPIDINLLKQVVNMIISLQLERHLPEEIDYFYVPVEDGEE